MLYNNASTVLRPNSVTTCARQTTHTSESIKPILTAPLACEIRQPNPVVCNPTDFQSQFCCMTGTSSKSQLKEPHFFYSSEIKPIKEFIDLDDTSCEVFNLQSCIKFVQVIRVRRDLTLVLPSSSLLRPGHTIQIFNKNKFERSQFELAACEADIIVSRKGSPSRTKKLKNIKFITLVCTHSNAWLLVGNESGD